MKATTLLKKGLESQSWSGSFWVDPVEMQCLDPTLESLCPIVGFFFEGAGEQPSLIHSERTLFHLIKDLIRLCKSF